MIDEQRVWAALLAKRAQFVQAQHLFDEELAVLNSALAQLLTSSRTAVQQQLAGIDHPGAYPTHDLDIYVDIVVPFAYRWQNHQEARQWARQTLEANTTFAIDGSQITPNRNVSLPVGLVQIGWFENPHTSSGRYVKDVAVEILAGDELLLFEPSNGSFTDEIVNRRRFIGEINGLVAYMEAHAATEPKPLCFYDGSLIISFIQQLHPRSQQEYIQAVQRLLETSVQTHVPIVGFVDTSYAKDMVTMLRLLNGLERLPLSDAALLRPRMAWGDRSQVFICARDDGVANNYYEQFCFTYLKTTADNSPARIEFPRWIYDMGEHERVLDLIRAECVVGLGYPYAIETADAVAVLTQEDRERFYALLQRFAAQNDLALRFSRKETSKRYRR